MIHRPQGFARLSINQHSELLKEFVTDFHFWNFLIYTSRSLKMLTNSLALQLSFHQHSNHYNHIHGSILDLVFDNRSVIEKSWIPFSFTHLIA